jgi:hypothetical protein
MIPEDWQNEIGALAGVAGLFLIPALLALLFRNKEFRGKEFLASIRT